MESKDLAVRFGYHPADTELKVEWHGEVRAACLALAETLVDLVPAGRELSLAVTSLEETMMWANAGIARSGVVA